MKKILGILFLLLLSTGFSVQNNNTNYKAFKSGEWFQFRIHYGIFNASYATLEVKDEYMDGVPVHHVIGKGRTTGLARLFFKVDDTYETFIDKEDGRPYRFIRNINEGGHTKDVEINFDYENNTALYHDKKRDRKKIVAIHDEIHDMVSTFYYLRNEVNIDSLRINDEFTLDMLYDDDETFKFRLKYLGKETIRTKFGKVNCLKFRPYVQSGRVFKEKESLTIWVSNDQNKIPLRVKADLAVGSIKADLNAYKGLRHQFKIVVK
ncbi:DUF3108 domain-containing protein [Leptobacterium flavescens]|uniref:DUF3108 domain-containing protein n=1 Tax=Leptobacterium flavescens TaxID=472055 RepID=A0A6P0URP4_9FLAO|nr:DUF3108 domain-containing protein [Leptobacterium flavescens]NER14459.1 DUF3108 domain-containing protein [Leptobacterium flavescens]